MGLFKKESVKESTKEENIKEIEKTNVEQNEIVEVKREQKDLCFLDPLTMEYIIKNFSCMSVELEKSLSNLVEVMQNTIDYIEDKSNEVIKKDRNFELSQKYRNTSISIYDSVQNIQEYTSWMKEEYAKANSKEEVKIDHNKEQKETIAQEAELEEVQDDKIEEEITNKENINEIAIFNDFSGKEPESFVLGKDTIAVDDWNDLLVKAAELLNSKYKKNKNSNKTVKTFEVSKIKSTENEFRDTAIEILNDYKISLDEFKIVVK